jgi:hypothetical protein
MDLRTWTRFEATLRLDRRFSGYLAGFQPGVFWRCERRDTPSRAASRALVSLGRRLNGRVGRIVARCNSRYWSYYAMGVYEKPATDVGNEPPFVE